MKTCKECNNYIHGNTRLNDNMCKECELYSMDWFSHKLDLFQSKTGIMDLSKIRWIISEDLKDLLLRKHMYSEYCKVGILAKGFDKYIGEISSQVVIKHMKVIAIIFDILVAYTDELKDQVILIEVR